MSYKYTQGIISKNKNAKKKQVLSTRKVSYMLE